MKKLLYAALIVLLQACAVDKGGNIRNDVFWDDADGQPIYSQGGGIFRFEDPETGRERYYWYGVHYREAELYREDPSVTYDRNTFEAVPCYVSDDMVNWTFCGDVLSRDEVAQHVMPYWVGRMGVAKVDDTYAMFIQCNMQVLVAESDSPTGTFKWKRLIDMTDLIGTPNTGDQTVFTDEDTGRSYLICSKANGRDYVYVAEIGRDENGEIGLLDCIEVFSGAGREGNCMFKYDGRYYLCASNLYGWDCSYAYFLVADNVKGPYRTVIADYERPVNDYPAHPRNDMQVMPGCEKDYAHLTQTGFFYTIRGHSGELVIYCGDRWCDFAGNGLGYNQWVPISFNGEVPYFNSLSSWNLDEANASWSIASDNDYVMNGSFEADRRIVPIQDKPAQDFITGWNVEFIQGNVSSLDDESSPRLNYEKTRDERQGAIGEKALLITDNVPFKRRVSQDIASIPDGKYRLTAKVKKSDDFAELYVYAVSGGKTWRKDVSGGADDSWSNIEISDIKVHGGCVEIGVYAEAPGGAVGLVDDISLIRL